MKKKQEAVPIDAGKWTEEVSKLVIGLNSGVESPPRKIENFEVPRWWECQWRRVRCNLKTCRFCRMMWEDEAKVSEQANVFVGELMRDDELSGETGRISPHDIVLDSDTEEITDEEWEEFQANQPPDADTFPMYRRLRQWSAPLGSYVYSKEHENEPWVNTDACKDLLWYATLLPSKVYRQLSTKWEVSRARDDEYEQEFGRLETTYTGYVIRQCVRFTEEALVELSKIHSPFHTTLEQFRRLKPSILAFAPRK